MARIFVLAGILIFAGALATQAANIIIVNLDGAGEGFNDPTPAAPVGGNPGVTIGQQRLNVFQEAADIWGAILPSAVTVRVQAQFNALGCNATSAVLGGAGPIAVASDFPGAEVTGTWYHVALANKLAGFDLDPPGNDISATFNSSIDNNNSCLSGINWYYGYDGNEGNDVELLTVVLHELAHGLGFGTLVTLSSGAEFLATPDIYETFIRDNSSGLNWDNMSNPQRSASAVNTGNVVWDGPMVTSLSANYLLGTPIMTVNSPMTIPSPIALGLANFGPSVTASGITGDVILVDDGTGTTSDACEAIINGAQVAGKIALIDRGICTFVSKALAAQAVGAIAVVIVDNAVAASPPGLGGTDPTVTIPVVSITLANGNAIKAELGSGVNVTLHLDPADLAGADMSNRVQLYAPNPVQGGSSIAHWDATASPNLLMEPAINSDLSSSLDLTVAHFADIGWLDGPTGINDNPVADSRLRGVKLLPNYPNPFNPRTAIRYSVSGTQDIRLEIFDVQGRLVRTLVNGVASPGTHETAWDGRDNRGAGVGSGVYFVRLAGAGEVTTRKIVLVK